MTDKKRWIELVTGTLGEKRRYRDLKARERQMPDGYRTAIKAIDRYLMYRGSITKGDMLVTMLEDLVALFEQSIADGTPVRGIVGDDPVGFAEDFLRNYADGEWIDTERRRLVDAIERAERAEG